MKSILRRKSNQQHWVIDARPEWMEARELKADSTVVEAVQREAMKRVQTQRARWDRMLGMRRARNVLGGHMDQLIKLVERQEKASSEAADWDQAHGTGYVHIENKAMYQMRYALQHLAQAVSYLCGADEVLKAAAGEPVAPPPFVSRYASVLSEDDINSGRIKGQRYERSDRI